MSRKLHLKQAGSPLAIDFQRRGDLVALDVEGRRVEASVSRDGIWFDVRIGGRAARCAVARGKRGLWVSCEGRSWLLEEERHDAGPAAPSADELRAPMTGRVVQVSATKGASVKEGDLLVTIEAMKMEFKLAAPEEGVVEEVRCTTGDRVELGDLLVVLEPKS